MFAPQLFAPQWFRDQADSLLGRTLAMTSRLPLASQAHLWSQGLSGDLPIVLVRILDARHATLVPILIRVQQWWRQAAMAVDLVFLHTGAASYEAPLRELLFAALRDAHLDEGLGRKGGVHLLTHEQLSEPEWRTLLAVARLRLDADAPSLASALLMTRDKPWPQPLFQPLNLAEQPDAINPLCKPDNLLFDNGVGGFIPDSQDYLVHLAKGQTTPTPWCNILANKDFGSLVSESGLGFTWSLNSGEHRLTPWSNDDVRDPQSEALYLRDEETALIWTPTPLPAGGGEPCQILQQAGATTWRRNGEGLTQSLTVFVPPHASVKLALLSVHNPSARPRRLTATYYAHWLLGAMANPSQAPIECGFDADSQALMARHDWNSEFAGRTAFLAASRAAHSLSCDREAFLGRHHDPARPAGLVDWRLNGELEQTTDPCAAFQVLFEIAPGDTEELVFVLGEGQDLAEAGQLARHWTELSTVKQALADNDQLWRQRLGAVQVSTPDPAFDLMVNRWLIQQTLASRVLARAGFQQAGGALGFRDQLQDMLALLFSEPARVRAHILLCAAHQFEEGDVLHWWHPPRALGVKTRFSDDLLWLIYVTGRYVSATGDSDILQETVAFLSAPPLNDDEADRYGLFETGNNSATLFEHCRRALNHGITSGSHGLPLIGAGDWNDGMNRVGIEGRGESVWLAWFAASCVDTFVELAGYMARADLQDAWRPRAAALRTAADTAGWDGQWYARAFDDQGLAWGTKECTECQIDSISQSWAVLTCGALTCVSTSRAASAVNAATQHLLDAQTRVLRLLTPPFAYTSRDPGYIRAYPPGIRENGGQYNHAAAWLGLAHTRLGNGAIAYKIFNLINPIRRSATYVEAQHYRGEPYVLAADICSVGAQAGQAGWTWYTGAAAWSWQLAVEGILGLSLQQGALHISPCLPPDWGLATSPIQARIKGPNGVLLITIEDPQGLGSGQVALTVDGQEVAGQTVAFPTDGSERQVTARLYKSSRP